MEVCRRRCVQIGIRRKVVVAVSEPGLNILQRIAQVQHNGGTAMAKIMKPDGAQIVLPQQLLELL